MEFLHQTVSLEAESTSLLGDKFSLEILFDNLLKNAIKYSGRGTEIHISIEEQVNNFQIVVEDSGVGITKEHLDKVFLRFYRVKQHSETGSGLGLSIVKHIVDLHEGNIQLMTSNLGGLKVVITLPKSTKSASINE